MRQIEASEIKPGMTIRWETQMEIKSTTECNGVGGVLISGDNRITEYLASDAKITVLSEPAPAQPEEPTEFGARVTVAGRKMIRCTDDPKEPWPWRGEALKGDPVMWSWGQLAGLGPVTVVPDQGWTVPDDTPEVPDRIEEWPEDDTALRAYKWMDFGGFLWLYGGDGEWRFVNRSGIPSYPHPCPGDGPWTRVTDA